MYSSLKTFGLVAVCAGVDQPGIVVIDIHFFYRDTFTLFKNIFFIIEYYSITKIFEFKPKVRKRFAFSGSGGFHDHSVGNSDGGPSPKLCTGAPSKLYTFNFFQFLRQEKKTTFFIHFLLQTRILVYCSTCDRYISYGFADLIQTLSNRHLCKGLFPTVVKCVDAQTTVRLFGER